MAPNAPKCRVPSLPDDGRSLSIHWASSLTMWITLIASFSIHFHDMFAVMLWVADQPLSFGIDDPVEQFQWDLTDQHRELVADFTDIDGTVASLNRQPHGPIIGI